MKKKKLKNLSVTAFIISILPLATFIPVLFDITLTEQVRSIWAGVNIFSILIGLILSIICTKNRESRSAINIVSTFISSFWVFLMGGIVILAQFTGFVQ